MTEVNLTVGEHEIVWSIAGAEVLSSTVNVTETEVTCIEVEGGTCGNATPPGVVCPNHTITGYPRTGRIEEIMLTFFAVELVGGQYLISDELDINVEMPITIAIPITNVPIDRSFSIYDGPNPEEDNLCLSVTLRIDADYTVTCINVNGKQEYCNRAEEPGCVINNYDVLIYMLDYNVRCKDRPTIELCVQKLGSPCCYHSILGCTDECNITIPHDYLHLNVPSNFKEEWLSELINISPYWGYGADGQKRLKWCIQDYKVDMVEEISYNTLLEDDIRYRKYKARGCSCDWDINQIIDHLEEVRSTFALPEKVDDWILAEIGRLHFIWEGTYNSIRVDSLPKGARVYLKKEGEPDEWFVGLAPLDEWINWRYTTFEGNKEYTYRLLWDDRTEHVGTFVLGHSGITDLGTIVKHVPGINGAVAIADSTIPSGIYTESESMFNMAIVNTGERTASYRITIMFQSLEDDFWHEESFRSDWGDAMAPNEMGSLPVIVNLTKGAIPEGQETVRYIISTVLEAV